LDWCNEILRRPLPKSGNNPSFAGIMRAKSAASQTVLTLVGRVNDQELRKRALDRLPDLLKIIQDEEMKSLN
jgi:hypothetical protein